MEFVYFLVLIDFGFTSLSSQSEVIPFSVSLLNDLANPVFDGVGLAGFKSRAKMLLYWPELRYPYYSLLLSFHFSYFCL